MSQDASTSQTLQGPAKNPSPHQPWEDAFGSGVVTESGGFSAESYADRLMDELFGDVEQALDLGIQLPETPLEPEAPPRQTEPSDQAAGLRQFVLPLALSSQQDLVAGQEEHAIAEAEPASVMKPRQKGRLASRSHDRLLIAVGCLSIIAALAIWFINQDAKRQPASNSAASTQVAANSKVTSSDNQFANYVNQALQAIEQKTQPAGSSSTLKPGVPSPTMPTVTLPATRTPTSVPLRPSTGLSRLYTPYQLPQNLLPNRTIITPLPSAVAPAPVAAPAPAAPSADPGIQRKVVGLMERTDRFPAVALIEINGVVQRFQVGESVGSSGWNLVEVSKNQAIVRRNGEVRSIFIGQSF